MQAIIKIENLSKQYRLGVVGTGTLSNDLKRWWHRVRGKEDPFLKIGETNIRSKKGDSEFVWALKDINLEVMPGEVLGVIGKNGAGKSTLLKILSRVTGPTTGSIQFNGRIGSLLEVGTGFHPELTGRENIFLNGAILGMTKAEIRGKLDEIVDFSGVERYVDTPVKRYSSGMMVRLGFAVAAHLEPEILVVDEVLAVGDAEFQKKAIGKMQDVSRNEGRTVLFVSHNMGSIRNLCKNGVVLENGQISMQGNIETVVEHYIDNQTQNFDVGEVIINSTHRKIDTPKQLEIIGIKRLNTYLIASDETIEMDIAIRNNNNIKKARIIGMLNYADDTRVGLFISKDFNTPESKRDFTIHVKLSNHNLTKGKYYLDFNIGTGDFTTAVTDFDLVYKTITFEVEYMTKRGKEHIIKWNSNWGRNCYQNVDLKIVE